MSLTRFQDTAQIEKDVEQIIRDLEILRKNYEQFFMGLIKENPMKIREKVVGLIRRNHGVPIQNARLKFRYQQSVSRFNTYCTYWDRILRKIEEGTYERDVFKANLHLQGNNPQDKGNKNHTDDLYDLYQRFQSAKDQLKQKLDHVSFKKFQSQMTEKKAKLEEKHKGHDFSFKIQNDQGKVKIIPVAVKKKDS